VSQALSSLAKLTLRQLRQVASDLGVSLYSRKTKEQLVDAITSRQPQGSSDDGPDAPIWSEPSLSSLEATLAPALRPESTTRVVFLPGIPSGPMSSGKSQTPIGIRPNRPAPASSACGSPMSPA
jgi:hypothetical protein